MKKIIYIFIFLVCFCNLKGKNYIGEISKIYYNERVAIGVTNRIEFSGEVKIIKEDGNTKDFFQEEILRKNSFINFGKIELTPINSIREGNRIYFKSSSNEEGLQEIRFILEGEIIFNWLSKNKEENIKIGYINSLENPVFLSVNMEDFNPLYSLKIKVIENMNLGKVQAGEKLSTKDFGTPANISIEGQENKSINITIPKTTTIKNSKNDTLLVNLKFRENNKQNLVRKLSPNEVNTYRVGNKGSVISKNIFIDGESQTKKNTNGVYRGFFTVKVEYLD